MRLIDADVLESKIRKQYCEDCDRRKGIKYGKMRLCYEIGDAPCRACSIDDMCAELGDALTIQPVQRTDLLKDEIKRMKRSFTTCINSDYYTGYMSALSAVEGYIAQWEGEAK